MRHKMNTAMYFAGALVALFAVWQQQLVAQAQEEFARETQKVMNDSGSATRPSDSIQQER